MKSQKKKLIKKNNDQLNVVASSRVANADEMKKAGNNASEQIGRAIARLGNR